MKIVLDFDFRVIVVGVYYKGFKIILKIIYDLFFSIYLKF